MSRVVMFDYKDVTTDARVLREAAALAAAGHEVAILAHPRVAGRPAPDLPAGVRVVELPVPVAWQRRWQLVRWPWRARGLELLLALPWIAIRLPFHLLARRRPRPAEGDVFDWLVRWRFATLAWNRAAARAAPAADVYHGHDLTALPAAVEAASRHGGQVVYDSHEIFLEAGGTARRPRWARSLLARLERRLVRRVAALVTVNELVSGELGRRLRVKRRIVVHNTPPRPTGTPAGALLREAAGIGPDVPLIAYHGYFAAQRGMEQLAAALDDPSLEATHLVYLGFGPLKSWAADLVRVKDRVHLLPAVMPEVVPAWLASADVAAMPIQRSTLNHWLATPNKLFEALAAGVPVVASDFPGMRRILLDDPRGPLGAVCDPSDPADIARAIRSILDLPPDARADLRARCLRAARECWNWEAESTKLVALYSDLERETHQQ